MGDFRVRKIRDHSDRQKMYASALDDIKAFERMWNERMFDNGQAKIGAEQELCIVNEALQPTTSALDLLDNIKDDHYTNELGLFNLEINLDPELLQNKCFSTIENKLIALMAKGQSEAAKINQKIVMAGILPTIDISHLQFKYMTPIPRYQTLSNMFLELRGSNFEIHMTGVDELIMSLDSVLFEACNTSFQLHLQISQDEFVSQFNWSQMISGPVLSACVNSPLLFGKELWSESRIAVFKQSLDTRSSSNQLRNKMPRVYFGDDWLKDSPLNLWKKELMHFPLILTSDDIKKSTAILDQGSIPELRAIRLHNGTTYTWNRLCYGTGNPPHLRIECRYLPAGPSIVDEIANFAFWIGLMKGQPENWDEIQEGLQFKVVKDNFTRAARTGLDSVFNWMGESITAKKLILEKLIPIAKKGLKRCKINQEDIDKYLGIIQDRVDSEQTGSKWTINNYRSLSNELGSVSARQEILSSMFDRQKENIPVHQWSNVDPQSRQRGMSRMELTASNIMSQDIFTVNEHDCIGRAQSLLEWNNIHHLPVEDRSGNVVGILTDGLLTRAKTHSPNSQFVNEIMNTDFIHISPHDSMENIKSIMDQHKLSGVPVIYKEKLVGLVTRNDF